MERLYEIKNIFKKTRDPREIYEKNKIIFDKIKENLREDQSKADEFIHQMIVYFELSDKKFICDLTLILKSKIYEKDIKSYIYFFENLILLKDNNSDEFKIFKKYEKLSEMNLNELKQSLIELNNMDIYDYE